MTEFLAALVGAVVGGLVALFVQRSESTRQSRKSASLDLLKQWHSLDMVRARNVGFNALVKNLGGVAPLSWEQLHDALVADGRSDEWLDLSRVVHFLEFAADLFGAGELDTRVMRHAFGRGVGFWHDHLLSPWVDLSNGVDRPEEIAWYPSIKRFAAAVATP